jgi:hypothetical protein
MAGEEPKSSKKPSAAANVGDTSRAESLGQAHSAANGVSILGFRLQSAAREAGMKKGDVIIEYDGVRNLSTETLSSLTAAARPEGIGIDVVFLRDGQQDTLRVPSGSLGISAMDITIQGRSALNAASDKIQRIVTVLQRVYLALAVLGVLGLPLIYFVKSPGVETLLQGVLVAVLDGVSYIGLRLRRSWVITLILIVSIFGCLGMFVQILQPADEIKALLDKVVRVLILLFFAYQIYFFRKPEVRRLFADKGYLVF